MALPAVGVPFVPSNGAVVRDAILADLRLEVLRQSGNDPAVQPGTSDYIFAEAHANAAMLQYASIETARTGLTPLDATGDKLEAWRKSLGLPEVEPTVASGKLRLTVTGTSTIFDGTRFTLPNGLRGKVNGTFSGVVDGTEVDVVMIDSGSAGNADGGTTVQFVSPPINVAREAEVSKNEPLTGGFDEETDPRKRARILNALANKTGGGNWAHMREVVLNELPSVQDVFVYPALGGPASTLVVPVRDFNIDRDEYTRALNSNALSIARNALYREMPDMIEIVVQAPNEENADVGLEVTIPDSINAGGGGNGWLDETPWPDLVAADNGRVTVSSGGGRTVVLDANTTTAPTEGITHVMWWSPTDRRFRTYLVVAQSGSSGSWSITVDRTMVDSSGTGVAVGDFICPASVNSEEYGKSWIEILRKLGAGESVSSSDDRAPRSLRHPEVTDQVPSSLSFLALKALSNRHDEITDAEFAYRSITTPTVPSSVSTAPRILVPRHLGIYRKT